MLEKGVRIVFWGGEGNCYYNNGREGEGDEEQFESWRGWDLIEETMTTAEREKEKILIRRGCE